MKYAEIITEAAGVRTLYHGTDQSIDIAQCRPLTHFGNRKAAINRIAWKVGHFGGERLAQSYYLYGVEFVTHKPLWFHDNGFNHNLPATVEAIYRALAKQSLQGPSLRTPRVHLPYNAQGIADGVRSLGFDSLAYRNRAELGTSYVALGPENIQRVVSTEMITGKEAYDLAGQWHNERYGLKEADGAERWDSQLRQWVTDDDPEPLLQTVEVNGVPHPIYNSENALIAPTEDAQVAFWRWFGKSKIVDQHGRPLVVHRGDRPGKSDFTGRDDPSNHIQGNIFFTNERDVAKGYTPHRTNYMLAAKNMNQSHGLYSVYLRVEKPLVVDAKGESWSRVPVAGRLKKAIGGYGAIQIDDLALHAQQTGKNDGLIVKDVWDQFGGGDQFVVFSSQQIKLTYAP